jgi:predicted methyltransferase
MSVKLAAIVLGWVGMSVAGAADSLTVSAAIKDPRRPCEQMQLDAWRKPADLIVFGGVKPGDRVGDFMPGNAYFTRIFSDVVGPAGHVYGFIPTEQLQNCDPSETVGSLAIARDRGYTNVTITRNSLDRFSLPEKLDVLWTAQNYHDLHDPFLGPPDIATLNRAFFDSLKPGGVFIVIDHVAQSGSGIRDTNTLHRIDPERMRKEIESAGFVLEDTSQVLRNPEDDHSKPVFDSEFRGRTDQVVMRFRKPG